MFSVYKDIDVHTANLTRLEAELPQGDDKLKPEASKAYKELQREIAGVKWFITSCNQKLEKLTDQMSARAHQIQAIRKNVLALAKLSLASVPNVPYFMVNGTKYKAKENAPVRNEEGVMELYVETNPA